MNTIQERWESFKKDVIPEDAPEFQVQDMKRAFYSGVIAMMNIDLVVSEDGVSDEAAVAMLEGCHQEARQYVHDLNRGAE